jgi:nucleoside-diphosphate-sugar epimerase
MNILIFGCGYIGTLIAVAERKAGHSVHCIVRGERRFARLRESGFSVERCDLDGQENHLAVTAADALYYLVPPPPEGTTDLRSRSAVKILETAAIKKTVLISTTGVYGDCDGDWIDETRPLRPVAERSIRRVDAENVWREWAISHDSSLSILRVAGIYSADRLPEKRLREATPVLIETEAPFSNRIHADDLVRVCFAAARSGGTEIYNIADDEPTTMSDYFFRVADALLLPRPPQISLAQARAQFSAAMMSYLNESRRIDNRKMKTELGVSLRYPTLSDGLKPLVPRPRR